MNYVNYVCHSIYSSETYHRRFDLDLPQLENEAKRVALASLPLIAMYRPAGLTLSIGSNALRAFSHLENAVALESEEEWEECALQAAKAAMAALALSTTLFHFTASLLITTVFDILQGMVTFRSLVEEGAYERALEEALQTLSSFAYLGFMGIGTLEIMVVFSLLQAAISWYQAKQEIEGGHYIEGVAKLALSAIRLSSAKQYFQLIERRDALLKVQKIQAIFQKIARAKEAFHLTRHPLSSLKERIAEKDVVLNGVDGMDIHFGAHFHGHGQTLVKGENLAFRTKIMDGEEIIELDFKINHAFRKHLTQTLDQISNIQPKVMKEILSLTGSHADDILIGWSSLLPESASGGMWGYKLGEAHKIEMKNLGTILIGAMDDEPNLYDKVVVQMKSDKTLYDLHELLSFVDMTQALSLSTADDIERLKMGHLFRTFFPREALSLERTEEFFTLSLEDLKNRMIEKAPDTAKVFDTYFDKVTEEHLVDGRVRYRINGLANAAYEAGARGLIAGVTGAYGDEEIFKRVASMLKLGMLATEVRHINEIDAHGLGGSGIDYVSGGADSVFTQMITKRHIKQKESFNDFPYDSKVRILFSLDALETGTYQYHTDNFGHRTLDSDDGWWSTEPYEERDNILEFIKKESALWGVPHSKRQEVMIKERIAPPFFKALIVQDEKVKEELIASLERYEIIQNGLIFDRKVDEFIRIGGQITEEILS